MAVVMAVVDVMVEFVGMRPVVVMVVVVVVTMVVVVATVYTTKQRMRTLLCVCVFLCVSALCLYSVSSDFFYFVHSKQCLKCIYAVKWGNRRTN